MHRLTVSAVYVLLLAAVVVSVAWVVRIPDFEPAITCLSLVAAITGLFIDRHLGERERRQQLLVALVHEVHMNLNALKDVDPTAHQASAPPRMMPRFYNSTTAGVIASGVLATKRDAALWKLLHSWLQRSTEANARFAVTEACVFEHPETATVFYEKLATGVVMKVTRETLSELATRLVDGYKSESGIGRDTVLSSGPGEGGVA